MHVTDLVRDPYVRACVSALGWTLLHFAWQGVAIGLAAWATMTLMRGARTRYAIGCVGLLAMIALPIATYTWMAPTHPPAARVILPIPFADGQAAAPDAKPSAVHAALPTPQRPISLSARLDAAQPTVVGVWIVGVAALLAYRVLGLASIARLRRTATPIVDAVWTERMQRLARTMRIGRTIALLATTRLDCPAVIGVWRPAILWPVSAMTGLSPLQVEALLAHELAHVRRHDFLVNLLQTLVETLLFYHPAVWWLSSRVRQEREHCCDDLAARAIGDPARIADALAAMELHRQSSFVLSSNGGSLVKRIRRLVASPTASARSPRRPHAVPTRVTLAAVVAVACIGVAVWSARGEDDAKTASTSPSSAPTTGLTIRLALPGETARNVALHDVELQRMIHVYGEHLHGLSLLAGRIDVGLLRRLSERCDANLAAIQDRAYALSAKPLAPALDEAALRQALPVGEYYMGGHIERPGVYSLSGRWVSLGQAILAAGLTSETAGLPPERQFVQLIRRLEAPGGDPIEYTITLPLADALHPDQTPFTAGWTNSYGEFHMLPNDQVVFGVTGPATTLPTTLRVEHTPMIMGQTRINADHITIEKVPKGPGIARFEATGNVSLEPAPPAEANPATTPVTDYQLHPNDVVHVTILDLAGAGLETGITKRVTETGKITLPYIHEIAIGGMTEAEAEAAISKAYLEAHILSSAVVSLTTIQRSDGLTIALPGTPPGEASPQRGRAGDAAPAGR